MLLITLLPLLQGLLSPAASIAQEELPIYLRDRGAGVASSMFGTYIERGELLICPLYEYYHDSNLDARVGRGTPITPHNHCGRALEGRHHLLVQPS
ncbi:MAG: hypothetical protein PVJ64_11085 [Gemmatimonadales bacterium]